MVVVLHNIRSIHNTGSIFRTADATGIEKIYLCGITPEPVDRLGKPRTQFTKVSLGAEETVAYEKKSSTTRVLDRLKQDGYQIWAVEQDKRSTPFNELKAGKKKIALVLGNEVRGLPKPILKKADEIVEIPMLGRKESLNVAIAFAVVAFGLKYR